MMLSRNFAASGLALFLLVAASQTTPALAQSKGNYLPGGVIYNESSPTTNRLRLSRTQEPMVAPNVTPTKPLTGRADETGSLSDFKTAPMVKQTPTMDLAAAQTHAPESNQAFMQQTLETIIRSCYTLIATGVNSRHLAVPEEQAVSSELESIVAQNNAYLAKGYTVQTFQEIQGKLVRLQTLIYQYGTNGLNRQ